MSECDRRFSNGIFLLKCIKEEGHLRDHTDGTVTWSREQGFDYIYEDGMVVGSTLPRCEERLDVNTQCCEKAEPGKTRCRYHGPQVETLGESAARAPKFWSKVVKVTADANGVFAAGAFEPANLRKLSIAQRLAQRKLLNASLMKKTP